MTCIVLGYICQPTFSSCSVKVHKRILCTFMLLPTFPLANSSDSHLLHTTILLASMLMTFPKPATHFPTLSGGNLGPKRVLEIGSM